MEPRSTPPSRRKREEKPNVMGYLVILFIAAFLLMFLSYFMQRRTDQETIDSLKVSVSSMQSVQDMIADNLELRSENEALDVLTTSLTTENASLQAEVDHQNQQLIALDWLWRIQRGFGRGEYTATREMINRFEADQLFHYLPTESLSDESGLSPLEQYNSLLTALSYKTNR